MSIRAKGDTYKRRFTNDKISTKGLRILRITVFMTSFTILTLKGMPKVYISEIGHLRFLELPKGDKT